MFNLTLLLALSQAVVVLGQTSNQSDGALGGGEITYLRPKVPHKSYTTSPEGSSAASGPSRVVSMSQSGASSPLDAAKQFVQAQLKLNPTDYIVKDSYQSSSTGVTHIYLRQKIDNKEVFNANININVNKSGQIISFGDSFYRANKANSLVGGIKFPKKTVEPTKSIEALLKHVKVEVKEPIKEAPIDFDGEAGIEFSNVPGALHPAKAKLGWLQLENGNLEPVWDHQVEFEEDYFHGHVSAITNQPLSLINWVAKASYNVLPFGINDPLDGKRQIIKDPQDKIASPLGWHDTGSVKTTDSAGNNVYSVNVRSYHKDELKPISRVDGGSELNFDFEFDDTNPDPKTYQKASQTNLFYQNNMIHDLYYRYGFDEKAGNFQESNGDKGGRGNDAVIAHSQDPSGRNNAYFSTPPDGQKGRMSMFVFDVTKPKRDGDFDNGVIIHEYSHGLSTRLTGGPSNVDCLYGGEPGGLGEGWGDAIATMIRMTKDDTRTTDKGMGKYVIGKETIRKFVYSTSLTTNPETYEFIGRNAYQEVHNSGEVWATFVYELYWNLRDKLGFTDDWFGEGASNPTKYGNTLLLQLLLDGMKLQPCDPSFLDARDAIIQAEKLLTNGDNACALWKGFAKRGMGVKAKVVPSDGEKSHKNSMDVPEECN